jgi:hypothetical protein
MADESRTAVRQTLPEWSASDLPLEICRATACRSLKSLDVRQSLKSLDVRQSLKSLDVRQSLKYSCPHTDNICHSGAQLELPCIVAELLLAGLCSP